MRSPPVLSHCPTCTWHHRGFGYAGLPCVVRCSVRWLVLFDVTRSQKNLNIDQKLFNSFNVSWLTFKKLPRNIIITHYTDISHHHVQRKMSNSKQSHIIIFFVRDSFCSCYFLFVFSTGEKKTNFLIPHHRFCFRETSTELIATVRCISTAALPCVLTALRYVLPFLQC